MQTELQTLEVDIETVKKNIAMGKALERLTKMPEFQQIIIEGYFKNEAKRVVLLRADPAMIGERESIHVDRLIDGIGALHQYFVTIERIQDQSEQALREYEETRQEIIEEEMGPIEGAA